MSTLIHLSKVGLTKLTLLRWLQARESYPGGKKAWKRQRELLDRRTKSYTADEIRDLLDLGRGEYDGWRGGNKKAFARLSVYLTNQRNKAVNAAVKKLTTFSRKNTNHV